jgi:hypothetical protein
MLRNAIDIRSSMHRGSGSNSCGRGAKPVPSLYHPLPQPARTELGKGKRSKIQLHGAASAAFTWNMAAKRHMQLKAAICLLE